MHAHRASAFEKKPKQIQFFQMIRKSFTNFQSKKMAARVGLWSRFFVFLALQVLCCLLVGCSSSETSRMSFTRIDINGRDDPLFPLTRHPIYRARLPKGWITHSPSPSVSLVDTTVPLCEIFIRENGAEIRITIHNFPTDAMEERTPVQAQIQRWKRQFDTIVPSSLALTPQAFSGFSGTLLELIGTIKGESKALLGWSMQIAPEHYRSLSYAFTAAQWLYQKQMRADFTIKAVGDPNLMQQYREEIIAFARSFELIHEIYNYP